MTIKLAPYYDQQIEVLDAAMFAVPVTKVKKQIWNKETQEFEPRVYVRYRCDNNNQYNDGFNWLQRIYGGPQQYKDWWAFARNQEIWMDEKIYTFWRLRLGYES